MNTFRNPHGDTITEELELARSTEEEKQSQLQRLHEFHERHANDAPGMLRRLQKAAIDNRNVFEVPMDAAQVCSLGQFTSALFEVGASTAATCKRQRDGIPTEWNCHAHKVHIDYHV